MIEEGNRTSGRAIPVSEPYIFKASELPEPFFLRHRGIRIASIFIRTVTSARLSVIGNDILKIRFM